MPNDIAAGPRNLAHFTMWEEVILQIGDKIVFLTNGISIIFLIHISEDLSVTGNWPYYAYFHYLFNYGTSSKNSWLAEALCFAKDTSGQFNTLETDAKTKAVNEGFLARREWILSGREMETYGRFPFPLTRSLKMLINKVGMRITLRHAKDTFR